MRHDDLTPAWGKPRPAYDVWLFNTIALAMAAFGIFDICTGSVTYGISSLFLGFVWATFYPIRRTWISIGWTRGASATIDAMHEAQRRGLSFNDFTLSELERVIGHPLAPVWEGDE